MGRLIGYAGVSTPEQSLDLKVIMGYGLRCYASDNKNGLRPLAKKTTSTHLIYYKIVEFTKTGENRVGYHFWDNQLN